MLGPPPTSGTRNSLHELFLEKGAEQIPAMAALKKSDPKAFEKAWKSIREDGAYVEAGENDNVIVQKLEANKNAFGIFGYSFLEENAAKLRGVAFDGTEPTYDNIAGGKYKGSRPLFVYVKKQHVGDGPRRRQVRRRVRVQQGARRGRISRQEGPRDPAEGRARRPFART